MIWEYILSSLDALVLLLPFYFLHYTFRTKLSLRIAYIVGYIYLNVVISLLPEMNEYLREGLLILISICLLTLLFHFNINGIFQYVLFRISITIITSVSISILDFISAARIDTLPFWFRLVIQLLRLTACIFIAQYLWKGNKNYPLFCSKKSLLMLISLLLVEDLFFQLLFIYETYAGILTVFLISLVMLIIIIMIRFNDQSLQKLKRQDMQIQLITTQLKQSEIQERKAAKNRHDLVNELIVLRTYFQERCYTQGIQEINRMIHQTQSSRSAVYCSIPELNGLLLTKIQVNESIHFEVDCRISDFGNVEPMDFCVLVGNLLDNSIEECTRHPELKQTVFFQCKELPAFIQLCVSNRLSGKKDLRTEKNSISHGIGLESVQLIVSKYNGVLEIEQDKDFCVNVLLTR